MAKPRLQAMEAPQDTDAKAAELLQKLAQNAPEPISGGNVPPAVMAWIYEHLAGMTKEICASSGFELPEIVVSVDATNKRQLGHFKIGRDGLGLKWRVNLNLRHLTRPRGNVLATLLHEMLHAWQHLHGAPPKNARTHNLEFRAACERVGIPTNEKGHDLGITENGQLHQYLERHDVHGEVGLVEKKIAGKPKGSSLRKWSCTGCESPVNVRIARGLEFDATCNLCGTDFEPQE